jgi:hypothetical protein
MKCRGRVDQNRAHEVQSGRHRKEWQKNNLESGVLVVENGHVTSLRSLPVHLVVVRMTETEIEKSTVGMSTHLPTLEYFHLRPVCRLSLSVAFDGVESNGREMNIIRTENTFTSCSLLSGIWSLHRDVPRFPSSLETPIEWIQFKETECSHRFHLVHSSGLIWQKMTISDVRPTSGTREAIEHGLDELTVKIDRLLQ